MPSAKLSAPCTGARPGVLSNLATDQGAKFCIGKLTNCVPTEHDQLDIIESLSTSRSGSFATMCVVA